MYESLKNLPILYTSYSNWIRSIDLVCGIKAQFNLEFDQCSPWKES